MKHNLIFFIFISMASCSNDAAQKYKKQADAFAEKEDFYKAEKLYTKAIKKNEKYKDAYFERGDLRFKIKDYSGSISDFTKLLSLDSNYTLAWLKRGNVHHQLEEFPEAMLDYNKAINLDPKNEMALINRGTLFFHLKNYEKAIEDYSKAIALNPKNTQYYLNRARCYESVKKLDLNIKDLEKILELDPKSVISAHNLAFSYSMNKQYLKADSLFSALYDKNSSDPFLLNNYGYVKFKLGDVKKGKELITESLKINPENAYAYRNMALVMLAEKNTELLCYNIEMGLQKGFTKDYGSELEDMGKLYCKEMPSSLYTN